MPNKMEEFKNIVDYLLQTPPEDDQVKDEDVQNALTSLSEILKTFNSLHTSTAFNECLQRTLNLINEKIGVSSAAEKCSLIILNFLFINNYHHNQILYCPITMMQILLKLPIRDFRIMLQAHFKHIHSTILTSLSSMEQRKESIDLALKILLKLAKSPGNYGSQNSFDPKLIRQYLTDSDLITKLVPLLFADNKEQRKLAIDIIMAVTSSTFSFTTVTTGHIQSLKSGLLHDELNYVKKIEGLLRLNDEDWHQIWCCVIRLLGLELHKGGPLYVNALLEVLEEAFKSSLNATRISAFKCWQELILNFAIDIEELCTKKRIKLLLIPLKASNCRAELVALEKFKTWYLLLCKMSPRLFDFIEEALVPFLNFCFSIVPSHNSTNHLSHKKEEHLYLGGRFPGLLPYLIDLLLQLIGHRTKDCKCNPRVLQGSFIDLNIDNLTKISKILIKSVNHATLLVKSPDLQKTVDCLWYSLLQIIRKDETSGIREEFINNVIEVIDKLLAKNCIDIAAIIFEQTIIEKAWLFSSLDHEIQYTQNMADKRKLIFSIKKKVVLYNFINVLLEAGSGDSSLEMINNILFNVNFLLTLNEIEVYNYFLLLGEVIIRLPRIIKPFLCTPIEYLRRENNVSPMLNKWIELYRIFFCDNIDYPAEISVEFCVYLETITITKSIDVLIGNILNICIPKLNIQSVPNICIEKILKILIRLIENERCLVLNSFNKLLKVFYMNYGTISIIFKALPNFLKYQQNYNDFFSVLSTIGDIIAKVSTDAFLLTLILTSLKNFEIISAADEKKETEETKEIKIQVANLIKKCKLKLKSDNIKLQSNRSAKMVAMSTTETIPVVVPVKETKFMEKNVPKIMEPPKTIEPPSNIMETPRLSQISVVPQEKLMPKPVVESSVTNTEISNSTLEVVSKITENKKVVVSPGQICNKGGASMLLSNSMSPPSDVFNMEKLTPILRKLPRILPKPTVDNTKNTPNVDFVVIKSDWKFDPQNMSEKQKEKMKERGKDIPALYQDLSQSNSQDLFKTLESNEHLKENLTQNLTFKNAIPTENIVPKIQPPVPPVSAMEPDKKRARRRTITRVQKSNDSSIPSTSNATEINQNIAPILENLFPKTGDETKLKIKAERELKKLQIDCKRSLTVMGTAEKKTLRSRELSAIPPVTNSNPGNEQVKKRSKRIASKTSSPQVNESANEVSYEESEEVIESSQESSTAKVSKINCSKPIMEEKTETSPNITKTPIVLVEKTTVQQSSETDHTENEKIKTPDENVPEENAQIASIPTTNNEDSPKTDEQTNENLGNSMVNKLHSIIENNFSEVQTVTNSTVSESIPTTAEVIESRMEESNIYDKETESITDDFVENSSTNASFVEYKNADNSVLATSMMSSPNPHVEEDNQKSNDLEKTQEFLNSTLNISPIKVNNEPTNEIPLLEEIPIKETKSPEQMFSDEDERNQVPALGSESLIDFNHVQQSPSSRRKLHRARGRSAQLLDLLPDSGDAENMEMGHEAIKSNFKSNNLLTFEKELPSPLAKPSSSIMKGGNKRKQTFDLDAAPGESDSPKSKRKRVSFHDPPVSCEKQYVPDIQRNSKLRLSAKVFKKSQKSLLDLFKSPLYPQQVPEIIDISQQHPNGPGGDVTISIADQKMNEEIRKSLENERIDKDFGELSKDDCLIEPPTESQGSLDNAPLVETLNNVDPFFPELVDCTESIDSIFMDLTSPLWATSLKTVFDERRIYTIGQFAALSELELNRLPLREHKINNSRMALSKYLNTRKDAQKMNVNQTVERSSGTTAEVLIRRGVKRKRRFSLSLLEKDQQQQTMTLETKKEQLERIFDNCSDPNELSTLLSMVISKVQQNDLSTLLNMVISKAGVENVLKCTGQYASLNKSLEVMLKYGVSTVGGDSTYEKCVSTLKNITGVDYTEDADDVQDASITSMTNTNTSTISDSEESILNTTKKCVEMINTTAETVCERITSLIQTVSTVTTPTDSKK